MTLQFRNTSEPAWVLVGKIKIVFCAEHSIQSMLNERRSAISVQAAGICADKSKPLCCHSIRKPCSLTPPPSVDLENGNPLAPSEETTEDSTSLFEPGRDHVFDQVTQLPPWSRSFRFALRRVSLRINQVTLTKSGSALFPAAFSGDSTASVFSLWALAIARKD